jgi:hypothetical protein
MRKYWIVPLALVAAVIAAAMVLNDSRGVVGVFQLADPTGDFGRYLHLGGLAANLAVLFVAVCVLVPRVRSHVRLGIAAVALTPSVLEAVAALPCFLAERPGALCGLGVILVVEAGIPIVLLAAFAFIATSRLRAVKVAGAALAVVLLGSAAAAQAVLAPTVPQDCDKLPEVTTRSTCQNAFAERLQDETICRAIEFRSTRFTCLREVAVAKRQPRLCEEIKDTGPIAVYESPASFFRDGCFQSLAYEMHDRSQCGGVEDPQLRASCENGVH